MCPKKKPILIGLTGTNGAGKGEVAAFFVKKGYTYFSLSDLLREELQKRGLGVTRSNLIRMGNRLRRAFSADILARRVMEKVKGKAVIDSIRNPQEVAYLKKQEGFVLISVDAPPEVRYRRVKARGRDESAASLEEFIAKEEEEMSTETSGQQLQTCMAMADVRVWNDGTIAALHKTLEKLL
ncbi:MAG: AAA family ATPase [Candidatus Aminicenantales bacterium]